MTTAERTMRRMRKEYFDRTAFEGQPKTPVGWVISKAAFYNLYPIFEKLNPNDQKEFFEESSVTFEGIPLIVDLANNSFSFLMATDEGVLDENLQTFREIRSEV